MRGIGLLWIALVFILIASASAVDISSCQELNTLDTSYNLTQNVSSSGSCFDITADNVTLDCLGFTITYDTAPFTSGSIGVNITNHTGAIVQNCSIELGQNDQGGVGDINILLKNASNSTITHNTLFADGAEELIHIESGATGNNISDNTLFGGMAISSHRTKGIVIGFSGSPSRNATGNTLSGNVVTANNNALELQYAIDHTFISNILTTNSTTGDYTLWLTSGSNNTFTSTTFHSPLSNWLTTNILGADYNFTNTTFNATNGSIRLIPKVILANDTLDYTNLHIIYNRAFLNSSNLSFFNVTAQITLRNLTFSNPRTQVDRLDNGTFVDCNATSCIEESYNNGEFVFNVSSFTTYQAAESASSCGNLTTNTTLINNVNSSGTCFNITADDLTLDCGGYSVASSDAPVIDIVSRRGVSIRNCNISASNSNPAFNLSDANNSQIFNNTISSSGGNSIGIIIDGTSRDNEINSNFLTSGGFSTQLETRINTTNTTFISNRVTSSTTIIINGTNHLIAHNLLNFSGGSGGPMGIEVTGRNHLIHNNTIDIVVNGFSFPNHAIVLTSGMISTSDTNITNNNIISNGTRTQGIQVNPQTSNLRVADNNLTIRGSGNQGIWIRSANSTFRNNTIIVEATATTALLVENAENNLLDSNTVINFTGRAISILGSLSTVLNGTFLPANALEINETSSDNHSSILFLQPVNTSIAINLSTSVNLTFNKVSVNASHPAGNQLNVSAQISLSQLNLVNPHPQVDPEDDGTFVDCPLTQCTKVSYTNNVFIFNVTHFTSYQAAEQANATVSKILVSVSPVNISGKVVFNINITNNGQTNITSLSVLDSFDASSLQFDSANITATASSNVTGQVNYTNLTTTIGIIIPNQTVIIQLNFTAIGITDNATNNVTITNIVDINGNAVANSNATASVDINGIPNASVGNVLVSVSPANISGRVSFLITISNNGTTNITSLTILDTFDKSALQFDLTNLTATASSNLTGQINYTNLTTLTGALIPNQTVTIQLNFTATGIADNATNNVTITNIVDLNNNPVPSTNASTGVEVQGAANLSITKVLLTPNATNVSQLVQFLITINNTGQTNLTSITLNDTFDGSYLQFDWANVTPTISSNASGFINFLNLTNAAALAVNQSIQIQLNFTAKTSTVNTTNNVTTNLGNVTLAKDQFNNDVINRPFVVSTVRINDLPNLTVTKTLLTQNPINRTQQVRFLILLNNTGNTNITTLPLNDTFNASALSFFAANISPSTTITGEIRYLNLANVSILAPGQVIQLELNFTALQPGLTTNNATVHSMTDMNDNNLVAPSSRGDLESLNITDQPNASISKVVVSVTPTNISNQVVFLINVTNTGETNITSITLLDSFDKSSLQFDVTNVTANSSSNLTGQINYTNLTSNFGSIIPNQTILIQLNFTAIGIADNATNNVTITNIVDLNGNTVGGKSASAGVEVQGAANLSITKQLTSLNSSNVSQSVQFLITINNTGQTQIETLALTDVFDGSYLGFEAANVSPSTANNNTGQITYANLTSAGLLAVNQSIAIQLNFTARASTINNSNNVTTNLANVTFALDEFGNEVITAPFSTSTVRIKDQPNVSLSKTRVTSATANVSSTIIFEVNVTNIGLTNLTSIPITDRYNGSVMGFVAANVSVAVASNATGTVTITNLLGAGEQLAPGTTRTVRLNFSAIAPATNTLNNASAGTVTDFNGYNPSNASSGDIVNITGIINISVAKSLESENPTNVSLTVRYVVNITNLGQHNLTTVALSDTFNASAMGFISANVSVTSASNATGTIFIANALTQALIPNASVIIALNFSAINTSTVNNNSVAINAQDLNGNNVTSSAFAIVPNITLAINVTNLSVTKIATTAYENISDNISFIITINNTGNQPVSGILINDSVSADYLEFARSNVTISTNSSSGVVINNALSGLANLSPSGIFVLNLTFTSRRNISNLTNTVAVTITDINGGTAQASASHNITLIAMNTTATAFSGNTTNFNNASDITNVTNATLENGNATIVWSNGINANGADFNSNVLLGSGFVIVNSSALNPTINSSANVTIKGVSCPVSVIVLAEGDFDNAEEIRQNGRDCEVAGVCTNKVCTGGVLSFTVSHFTGFAAGANTNLTIDSNSPQAQNNILTFNASYVNGSGSPISNGSCNLTLPNATTVNMTNLSTTYELNATFSSAGTFNYNVTCGAIGFTTLTAVDSFTISATGGGSSSSSGGGGGGGGRGGGRFRYACEDGMDNDGDGKIDLFDPGCRTSSDTSETDEYIPGTNITPSPLSPIPPARRDSIPATAPETPVQSGGPSLHELQTSQNAQDSPNSPSSLTGAYLTDVSSADTLTGVFIIAGIAILGIAGYAAFSHSRKRLVKHKKKR